MKTSVKKFATDVLEAAIVAVPVFLGALPKDSLTARAALSAITPFLIAFVAALRRELSA
jgi:hypothetical protein